MSLHWIHPARFVAEPSRWHALAMALLGAMMMLRTSAARADGVFDELAQVLSVEVFDGNVRLRLSGTLDLEGYSLPQPAPDLFFTHNHELFNPRLTLFLDAQLGPYVYAFAQARVDRGFDPTNHGADVRLDEYAIRFTPWEDGRLNVQLGKFATVVGNWVERHLSWDNPFITAPAPYGNLTAIWDVDAPEDADTLLGWAHITPGELAGGRANYSDKNLRLPIVWGPSYTSGVSAAGRLGAFDYAMAVRNVGLSTRPEKWGVDAVTFDHPAYEGRIGLKPNQMWNFGFSAAYGPYLLKEAAEYLDRGRSIGDYQQTTLAQDIRFAWHHLQIWAECFQSRFEVPHVGNADTLAYYIEAKYKFTPQLFGALRWNQQFYSRIDAGSLGTTPWGDDLWRADAALTYRFTPNVQIKLQYSLQNPESANEHVTHMGAGQLTIRF